MPKLSAEAEQALAEAERRLPLLRFVPSKTPTMSRSATGSSDGPSRGRRGQRGRRSSDATETSPVQGSRGGANAGIDPNALRRKTELLARADLIQSLVDAARSLPSQDGWVKGEFILRRVRELVPDFDRMAPRYAKFYRMLEDTGRFDVELRASSVFARPHEA
jgi:hypothetical protein